MNAPALEIDKVCKYYGTKAKGPVHAVKNLSLRIAPGEIMVLLGSSGCGKTSTLRMISGFESISKGEIRIRNQRINELPPHKRNVAMAFEGYSLYPPLSIFDNIGFALKSKKMSKEEVKKKVGEIAELLNISDILDRYPSHISAGQQQRASLGRALIRDAEIYLLDEPMGQLEPQLRAILRGRIKHYLKENHLTAVLVTHDQSEANAMADKIAIMEDGVLQQYANAKSLMNDPANLFVGTFFGEPPMNTFSVRPIQEGDQLKFQFSGNENLSLEYSRSSFSETLIDQISNLPELYLGIRPHAILPDKTGLRLKLISEQWLGDQSRLCFHCAGKLLVSVLPGKVDHTPGEEVSLGIAPSAIHLFEPKNGKIIRQ